MLMVTSSGTNCSPAIPDAAVEFYGSVVGWKARDSGMGGGMDYRLLSAGGTDVGGLMKLPADAAVNGMRPTWLGYVGVDDVDATVKKIEQAGGAVHMPPTDIPGVGRFAMVADPQGVTFYVMRGTVDGTSEAFSTKTAGHCSWNELVTSDQAAALDFYVTQFGWEHGDSMPMGKAGDYRFLEHGGEMIGAVMNRMDADQPTRWNFYYRVPSITAAVEAIKARGGTIEFGPEEVPGGDHVINATDPQGVSFGPDRSQMTAPGTACGQSIDSGKPP